LYCFLAPPIGTCYFPYLCRDFRLSPRECQVRSMRFSQIFTVNSQREGRVHVLDTKPPPSAAFSPEHAERIHAQPNKVTGKYTGFLAANAHSVLSQDRNCNTLFGLYWDGFMPFYLPANGGQLCRALRST
jgi:hypothetical protein